MTTNAITYTRSEIEAMINELTDSIGYRKTMFLREGTEFLRKFLNEAITRKAELELLIVDESVQTVSL